MQTITSSACSRNFSFTPGPSSVFHSTASVSRSTRAFADLPYPFSMFDTVPEGCMELTNSLPSADFSSVSVLTNPDTPPVRFPSAVFQVPVTVPPAILASTAYGWITASAGPWFWPLAGSASQTHPSPRRP
jgi:hypothetical protein